MSGRYDILLRRFLTGVNPYIKLHVSILKSKSTLICQVY
jgi:hypothetical protein